MNIFQKIEIAVRRWCSTDVRIHETMRFYRIQFLTEKGWLFVMEEGGSASIDGRFRLTDNFFSAAKFESKTLAQDFGMEFYTAILRQREDESKKRLDQKTKYHRLRA